MGRLSVSSPLIISVAPVVPDLGPLTLRCLVSLLLDTAGTGAALVLALLSGETANTFGTGEGVVGGAEGGRTVISWSRRGKQAWKFRLSSAL